MPDFDVVLPYLLAERASRLGERPFIRSVTEAKPRTYADVADAAWRWSGVLSELGVGRGDFVASMLPNGPQTSELWLGINGVGAVEVPVHTEYMGKLLIHVLNTVGARVVVVADRFLDRVLDALPELDMVEAVVVVDPDGALPSAAVPVLDGRAAVLAATPLAPIEGLRERDICTVLFTSGTTGASKGVLISYAHLRASTEGAWPLALMSDEDVNYLVLPNFHISGKVAIDSMLAVGGQVVIRERYRTSDFWRDVRAHGATAACMMGAMVAFLLAEDPQVDDADNPLAKTLVLPLPGQLAEFRSRFDVGVRTIYNQTETSVPVSSPGFDATDHLSCGQVRDGYQVRLVDDDDQQVPVGAVGELIVRAEKPWTMLSGYLGLPEKTLEMMRNQWVHTGDAFRMDEGGNFYFVDRIKDAIRRRGENISSVEVEEFTCEHTDVIETAAVPVPSSWTEEDVMVYVIRKPGSKLSEAELWHFLETRMPRFMLPRYIEFVEDLPKTPTQKVRKAALREVGITATTWDRTTVHDDSRSAVGSHNQT